MHAHKLKVTIQEDHRVEVQLPDDFPEGPAEIIVLTNRPAGDVSPGSDLPAQHRTLAALAELRSVQLTPEEEEVLDAFETFRHEHPIRFASLKEED
ncbi:MAG TPA: hypothetical protein VF756_08160 [Thermoanaerobaculia bacterium]